jgi:ParB family chromosome partitioning protein
MDKTLWTPEYYCRDPQACGLILADFLTRAEPIVHGQGEQSGAEAAARRAEAQRARRRKVLALNKLGVAAQQVRRAWVRDHLLTRKTPVKARPNTWRS